METIKPQSKKGLKSKSLILTFILFFLIIVTNSLYYNYEGNYIIITQFDKVVNIKENSGIGVKIPFIQQTEILTKKIMLYDVSPSEVITKDKKTMIADTYATFRIVDPLRFLQALGNTGELEKRIENTVYGSLKTTLGGIEQVDIVEARVNNSINAAVMKNCILTFNTDTYGVELTDVQIKRFDLPDSNKEAVLNRMISERNQIAAAFSAEGAEEASKIRNTADKEASVILSQANSNSEKIRAEGENSYMSILASAYRDDQRRELYTYLRGLDALKVTMTGDKTLILNGESQLVQDLLR